MAVFPDTMYSGRFKIDNFFKYQHPDNPSTACLDPEGRPDPFEKHKLYGLR